MALVDDLVTLEERLLDVYLESREHAPTSVVARAADEVRLIVCNEIRERDPDVATAFTLYDRELRERLSKKEPVR